MGKLVTPEVYLVGYTCMDISGVKQYLKDSDNESFIEDIAKADEDNLSDGEILCSMFAKLCYASLSIGKNKNIEKTRDIKSNLKACFDSGHGSVFEHAQLNFIVHNCSRVLTHELVRHRVGTAFSQTSGRYVRGDEVNIVFDPILSPVKSEIETIQYYLEQSYARMVKTLDLDNIKDFDKKKKLTSALRRILPNGQSNEIAFSCNLRSIRHIVQIRTSRFSEWEIRVIFGKIYNLLKDKFPLLFYGAKEELVDNLVEVSGMKLQPYEKN